jgi:hypothetical protein
MRVFPIGIELALDVAVQRSHNADPREHRRPARRRHQDQRFHRGLSLRGLVLGLRKLRDVVASILKRDELPAAGQGNGIVEGTFPAALSRHAAA